MSLDVSRLAGAIKAGLIACHGGPAADNGLLECYCNTMATTIIEEFQDNAVVLPTNMLDSFSGQVTGTGEIT